MATDQLIHRIMAGEMSAQRSRALNRELGSLPDSEALTALLSHAVLSETERRRVRNPEFDDALAKAVSAGARLLHGAELPWRLRESPGTPIGIMVHGNDQVLAGPTLGIVGTRGASAYGRACAQKFAEAAARVGVTVISGGAMGIDSAAHKGALEAGGTTAAVLPVGVDVAYPAVNAELFRTIREKGCLVSQFAAGTGVLGDHRFLTRNTLIAALSDAVLVVEAPFKSGALHTAHAANEYGKDVFVVPANISQNSFGGSFGLIRDGAICVSHPDDVLTAMGIDPRPAPVPVAPEGPAAAILAVLSSVPKATELIVQETGLDTAEVLSELTMLELEGQVLRDGGGYAIRP